MQATAYGTHQRDKVTRQVVINIRLIKVALVLKMMNVDSLIMNLPIIIKQS
jgi:hypothetical protein